METKKEDKKSILDNKIIWLIVSSVMMMIISFFSGRFTVFISLPDKVHTLEYKLEKIEGGVGSIEMITVQTNTELKSLTRVLQEKGVIK